MGGATYICQVLGIISLNCKNNTMTNISNKNVFLFCFYNLAHILAKSCLSTWNQMARMTSNSPVFIDISAHSVH